MTARFERTSETKLLFRSLGLNLRILQKQYPQYIKITTGGKQWHIKKRGGSAKNGRDSHSKRLGVKKIRRAKQGIAGNIIIRQRGTKYHVGEGVGLGKDFTIYALQDGIC